MRVGDTQVGAPYVNYKDTEANIEALTGVPEGASAYATDTDKVGSYDGSDWNWEVVEINDLSDVDTSTSSPERDEVLKWNGSAWVPAAYNDTFALSITSFSDAESSPQLIGSGVWKGVGALAFSATYENGPPDSAYIACASWASNLTLTTPFTSGVSAEATNYPGSRTVRLFLPFMLMMEGRITLIASLSLSEITSIGVWQAKTQVLPKLMWKVFPEVL